MISPMVTRVRASDVGRGGEDVDDGFYCPDNYIDECGVCGGVGLRTWFIDNDGDGLGDPDTIVRSCTAPL